MATEEDSKATETPTGTPRTTTTEDQVVAMTPVMEGSRAARGTQPAVVTEVVAAREATTPVGAETPISAPESFPLLQSSLESSPKGSLSDISIDLDENMEESQEQILNLSVSSTNSEIQNYKLPETFPSTSSLELPVGGRLKYFVTQWEEMNASRYILDVLGKGYRIPFKRDPIMTTTPCMESVSNNPIRDQLLEEQFQELLDKRVLEIVPGPYYGQSYFSNIFMVPKPNGKWRPVIDLKRLNKLIICPHFKMDDLQKVWETLLPGNFAFSIDLKDAYLHVPIHKSSRKFLRVYRKGVVYQFRALPFGLCTAPRLFTKIVSEVKRMVHLQGINMCSFLDDWIHQTKTFHLGQVQAKYMVELCKNLGWIVNMEKSELVPTQVFKFIGVLWNLLLGRIFPTEENRKKVLNLIFRFLNSEYQTAEMWQSLIGSLTAQQRLVYLGRLHVRPFQWNLMSEWIQGVDSPKQPVMISPAARKSLLWWSHQLKEPQGVPLVEPDYDCHIFTDASLKGWGAHAKDMIFQGQWTQQESRLHINVLEMRAVINTLKELNEPIETRVLVATDNTTVVAHINKQGGTHSWQLMLETFDLFRLIKEKGWFIKARHIPGRFNVIADQLSRDDQIISTEWSLHPQVAQNLFKRWFRPDIDLFATKYNKKCRLYVSPVPDDDAMAIDGLSLSLEGLIAYAYPPHQILMKLLQKFQMVRRCKLIVIAPYWPNQKWFPVLHDLKVREPYQLPQIPHLLKQPLQNRFHEAVEDLDLHAFWLEKGFY